MQKEVILPIIKYWFFFIIIPAVIGALFGYFRFSVATIIYNYILFIAPFIFFFVPYKKIKKYTQKRVAVIVFSLIIPYLFIIYIVYKALENFGF